MLKFRSALDKRIFLMEMSNDIPPEVMEQIKKDIDGYEPTEDILELFFNRRRRLVTKLKDFKKSQATKGQWRKNRYKIMKGIRSFHRSTAGKRHHKAMSRFLVSREPSIKSPHLSNEALKALSSLETHLYIERDYFERSVPDEVDISILLEEVIPTIKRAKDKISRGNLPTSTDMELLLRITEQSTILAALANKYGVDTQVVEQAWEQSMKDVQDSGLGQQDDGFYFSVLKLTEQKLQSSEDEGDL
jgi:hypothetical protein